MKSAHVIGFIQYFKIKALIRLADDTYMMSGYFQLICEEMRKMKGEVIKISKTFGYGIFQGPTLAEQTSRSLQT